MDKAKDKLAGAYGTVKALQTQNSALRQKVKVAREAFTAILVEVGTSTLTNKIASRALALMETDDDRA